MYVYSMLCMRTISNCFWKKMGHFGPFMGRMDEAFWVSVSSGSQKVTWLQCCSISILIMLWREWIIIMYVIITTFWQLCMQQPDLHTVHLFWGEHCTSMLSFVMVSIVTNYRSYHGNDMPSLSLIFHYINFCVCIRTVHGYMQHFV